MSEAMGGGGLTVRFGSDHAGIAVADGVCLELPMPVLKGEATERIAESGRVLERDGFVLVQGGDRRLAGVALAGTDGGHAEAAEDVYRRLLSAVGDGWKVYRIWNYVPAINAETGGLENYRAFNLGRWRAYGDHGPVERLPAASAVGVGGNQLAVVFVAGRERVEYFENPEQVPAYQYPEDYGPRPPCFCRGARVGGGGEVFLSGTASIRGHRSEGEGDLERQVEVTCANVETMFREMGVNGPARYKCYVRHERDVEEIAERLGERMPDASYLKADICRRELLLEIEAVCPGAGAQG